MLDQMRFVFCLALVLLASSFGFAATEERVTHQTFDLNEWGTIELSNVNGDVTIRGWDKNQVDMKATKRGPSDHLDEVEIEIQNTPERLSIETKYPRRNRNTNVSVAYELMVPKHAKLDPITNVNGGIEVTGVQGEIRINTVNGSAEMNGTTSSVEAETVNGNITAKWNEFPSDGAVKMHTVNGSLELELPSNASADVQASSTNGSIRTDFPITVQGRFLSRKLEGKIGGGGSSIDLSTVNGAIDIVKAKN
ncbi:MAG: DUF4097 family beta strand repeat-containing protein [Acidobacteriota bacterium]